MGQAVLMVLSPLWFVGGLPAVRLPDADHACGCTAGTTLLVLVVLAGLAVIVDILRFRYHVPGIEWVNMVFVWGFAFQLGYFYGRISGVGLGAAVLRRPDRLGLPVAAIIGSRPG